MSRNQAKFFIRKGRLSVDGVVVTDPEFELSESSQVVFDREPISLAGYKYIVLHKPSGCSCNATNHDQNSAVQLLGDDAKGRYFYFVNVLETAASGLVVLSDDSRWANRLKKSLKKKTHYYTVNVKRAVKEGQLQQVIEQWPASLDYKITPPIDIQIIDDNTLTIKTGQVGTEKIKEWFALATIDINHFHLQQLGKLMLGDLKEGSAVELSEGEIRI